jgi:ParB family transcriptional regulator, chromosome partitioning protein
MTTKISVPLNVLRLSPLNVRSGKLGVIKRLAKDILAHGLIQNLVAYEEDGRYWMFARGKRLRALKHLRKTKAIKADYPPRVDIRSKNYVIALSLAENFERDARHATDMVCAFAAFRERANLSADAIGIRFGAAVARTGLAFAFGLFVITRLSFAPSFAAVRLPLNQ